MKTNCWMLLALVALGAGCATSAPKLQASMEPMAVQEATPQVLTENHFRQDRTGNLTEDQLREILESPVFLEEDTRLGIVPVATAYEADTELPLTSVPSSLSGALEKTGFFDVTTEVSTDWPKDHSVAGLRELAARYRAKYLLLYRHRFVDETRTNGWGWTYPTIVGILATPARTYEVAGIMEATLFDPRTGTILFTAFERVHAQERLNVWHPDHKHQEIKKALLEEGTDKLAKTVTGKVRRLVAARPQAPKNQIISSN